MAYSDNVPLNPNQHQPNILYIMADQMNAQLTTIHNKNSPIKMPHLAKLAEEGVVFDSAYTNSPLCAPSRFVMVSGQLPSKIGAWDNASILRTGTPTYAHYLRAEGYHTALAGKMHFIGPEQLHGYEERLTTDIYPSTFDWTVDWTKPEVRADWYHNMSSVTDAGPCFTSNQLDYDEDVLHQSVRYIWQRSRHHRSQPFCLTASFTHPHDPYAARQEFWDMYEGEDIPLPTTPAFPHDKQDPHSQRLLKVMDLWGKEMKEEDIKKARRAYFANCTYVDDKVGKLVAALRESGQLENTIIVFSGDHGDMLGERGLWYKMSYFEGSARVPLLIHYPKRFAPKRVQASVSTMDLLPTFVDFVGARLDPRLPLDGKSLIGHLEEGRGEGHDEVFGEYMGEGTISPLLMIRRGKWKFIYCESDAPQLYDLTTDPTEVHNLALSPSPEFAPVLAAFLDETAKKWDIPAITREVLSTQACRQFTAAALRRGRITHWDHQPVFDATKQYIRSGLLDDFEERARFPHVVDFDALALKRAAQERVGSEEGLLTAEVGGGLGVAGLSDAGLSTTSSGSGSGESAFPTPLTTPPNGQFGVHDYVRLAIPTLPPSINTEGEKVKEKKREFGGVVPVPGSQADVR